MMRTSDPDIHTCIHTCIHAYELNILFAAEEDSCCDGSRHTCIHTYTHTYTHARQLNIFFAAEEDAGCDENLRSRLESTLFDAW